MTPEEQIEAAMREAKASVSASTKGANELANLILLHRAGLVSDITIVKEAATLLQHSFQNFCRIAAVAFDGKKHGEEAKNDT